MLRQVSGGCRRRLGLLVCHLIGAASVSLPRDTAIGGFVPPVAEG
jgi:hypothetical protein